MRIWLKSDGSVWADWITGPVIQGEDLRSARREALVWLRRENLVPSLGDGFGYQIHRTTKSCIYCKGLPIRGTVDMRKTTCLLYFEQLLKRIAKSGDHEIGRRLNTSLLRARSCLFTPPDSSCFDEIPSPWDTLRFGVIDDDR